MPIVEQQHCVLSWQLGLPGCEDVLDGCELTSDVAAIVDKFNGLAFAVAVVLGEWQWK